MKALGYTCRNTHVDPNVVIRVSTRVSRYKCSTICNCSKHIHVGTSRACTHFGTAREDLQNKLKLYVEKIPFCTYVTCSRHGPRKYGRHRPSFAHARQRVCIVACVHANVQYCKYVNAPCCKAYVHSVHDACPYSRMCAYVYSPEKSMYAD